MSCASAVASRLPAATAAGVPQRAARPRAPACSLGSTVAQLQRWAPQQQSQQQQQWRRQQRRRGALAVRAAATGYGSEWSTPKDAYLPVGLSHCYVKDGNGKLADQYVIEPITAAALECMATGGKTSFKHVFSLKLGEALERSKAAFPPEFAGGVFCEDYETRCDACARTWMRPHPMDNLLDIVPLGQLKSSFNYSTKDKRVLNMDNVVNDDDNIKQDLSIDVYGRKAKEEAAEEAAADEAAEPKAAKEEEEDDMDALLSV